MDSFKTRTTLNVANESYDIFSLSRLPDQDAVKRLPFSVRVLIENLLRNENGASVKSGDIAAALDWKKSGAGREIAFMPARVLLQDFTGVPAVVDLAAMRDAMAGLGAAPSKINPLCPVDLVIDHSVQVDCAGSDAACGKNVELEFVRNRERYSFLRWGQKAFSNFRVVPPGTGIIHQVNMEYLAPVVLSAEAGDGRKTACFDTLVGTDSHTTMINGLGVLGWGVGGIEAEACMLGQPVSMRVPEVVGMRLAGRPAAGITATDIVLTVTQILRERGVVGKFVEFFGPGMRALSPADRATIANMGPEYGATAGYFPIDENTLSYMELSGRPAAQIELVRAYAEEQGVFYTDTTPEPEYTEVIELDLGSVVPSISGPKKPASRIALSEAAQKFKAELKTSFGRNAAESADTQKLSDGSVVIAAITSCTNTSNPAVMLAAGIVAKKAAALGLSPKPWVKTSLSPGSRAVMSYLEKADLYEPLKALGFHLTGFGCMTCIGNSGPLAADVEAEIREKNLVAASALSGNRNFEGRISPLVKANYLMSPPLVVAYAIAGSMYADISGAPLGRDNDGREVYLKDIWPTDAELDKAMGALSREMFAATYENVCEGSGEWKAVAVAEGETFAWDKDSTYVKNPPFFEGMRMEPASPTDISGARVLALLGDMVTTDHISPAGSIAKDSPAAKYLTENGVARADFNSYGSRRGNHEVMMRGTFANIRLRNRVAPGTEGGYTKLLPEGETMSIYDAAMRYAERNVPLIVIAGKEYGTGSSRDWAAKGPALLGVRAVIAESFERIHRSNLIGMGVLPLEFEGNTMPDWICGAELFDIAGISDGLETGKTMKVSATLADGTKKAFNVKARIDTAEEINYYLNGGILHYVIRQLAK